MASFQAKIGSKIPRKCEKKKLSFRFVPTHRVTENSKKKSKKIQKIKKYNYCLTSSQNRLEEAKKERK